MANDGTDPVATSLYSKLGSLHVSFSRHCIYRVPEYVRKGKETCYRPFLVSIGPVYYRDESLQAMEKYKLGYLRSFLKHGTHSYSLDHYIGLIRDREKIIRDCYEQDVSIITSNDFIEMVLLDAAFLICFLGRYEPKISSGGYPFDKNIRSMYCEIRRDLFLEDNQLPFFVLGDLFEEVFKDSIPSRIFHRVTHNLIGMGYMPLPGQVTANVEHLVDMMRIFCLPSSLRAQPCAHMEFRHPPSVTKLKAAGVKFVANKTKCLLDITFAKGVFEMPTIVVSDYSESLFRSIIAFEQRHHISRQVNRHCR